MDRNPSIMRILKTMAITAAGVTLFKIYKATQLKHFRLSEFGAALPFLSIGLLQKLDEFRERLGRKVMISPAPGALIRFDKGSESQHTFGRAADIMLPDGPDLQTAFATAKAVGFTGIGVAPQWRPYKGLHLDIRKLRPGQSIAMWGYAKENGKQVFISAAEALNYAQC